ncbi:hypothetical protein GSI_14551 [Ganoderma sinense ZZ0214-1]|uniref:Uncharacterized protein n=1 Tax=Ganoderma sinense ZZ0214-1 TaxID=1077348 RepID=A0A2G8RP20_9APHY|nr:hypothetical protein GSI_14551 [Ganoderma sinense ZZ0214-1]
MDTKPVLNFQTARNFGAESPNESNPGPRPPNPAGSGRTGRKVAGRPTLNGHWQGELPTQTLIHSKTTFIEEQRQHWQQVAYDPVSGAAWSTFTSKGIRSASTSVETQFVAPSGPPPVYHAQPAGTYSAPSTSQADMLNVVEPQYQFPGNLAQAPAHSRVAAMPSAPAPPQAMSYNYPAHGQAPPYCYPPGGAPQFDTRQPGSFHSTGQTYPNTGPTVDPRFHYQGGGNDEMWSFT